MVEYDKKKEKELRAKHKKIYLEFSNIDIPYTLLVKNAPIEDTIGQVNALTEYLHERRMKANEMNEVDWEYEEQLDAYNDMIENEADEDTETP